MTTQTYCTRADLESLWTPADVLQAADDDASGTLSAAEEAHIAWAIEAAASEMNAYLQRRYTLSELAANVWCRTANAVLAACLLAGRSGAAPPDSLAQHRASILADLERIVAGVLAIADIVSRLESFPTVTNFTTDLSQPHGKVRRVPLTSTGNLPSSGRKNFSV